MRCNISTWSVEANNIHTSFLYTIRFYIIQCDLLLNSFSVETDYVDL
jgi:hypothetical protein